MTAAFGRRNRAIAPPPPPTSKPQLVLTPDQRAYLFASAPDANASAQTGASPKFDETVPPHLRRAAWLSCAVMTAITVALTQIGKTEDALAHDSLATLPQGLDSIGQAVFGMMGPSAGLVALAWSVFVIAANLGANLWFTRKLAALAGWRGLTPFMASGAGVSVAIAFVTALLGLGESEIGYAFEALSGAGVAGLYRWLSGRQAA
jgi:hypothetical protein